jgi:hypothetical protein
MQTLHDLAQDYGWKFLVMLHYVQHIVKGFVYGLTLPGIDFVLKAYAATGPDIQTYKAFIMLPWGMKPICGLFSDYFPIFGYRKNPHMFVATCFGIAGLGYLSFAPVPDAPLRTIVIAFFLVILAVSLTDLLTEAKYAEQLKVHPTRGPDLMIFVWGGIVVTGLVATLMLGPILNYFGPQALYTVCLLPLTLLLIPISMNYLGDEKMSDAEVATARAKARTHPEMLFLTGVICVSVIAVAIVSLAGMPKRTNAIVALTVGVVTIGSFLLLTSPIIGRMNAFAVLQTFCAISIDGATFYFFTDDVEQFRGGPNFSIYFFTTGLGIVVAVMNLIGLWTYNRYMKTWSYRNMYWFSNALVSVVHLWGILIYSRYNLVVGIPDDVFALTTAAMFSITHQWMWMPSVLILGQLCPKGTEATMYALLAGCHNLGSSGASMIGAYALEYFEVTPNGSPNEGHRFANLWKVALIGCILPTLTMFMIPVCIPDAKQTERLISDDHHSATEGSPWSVWTKRWRADSSPEETSPLNDERRV